MYALTLMHHAINTDLLADNHGFSKLFDTWAETLNFMRGHSVVITDPTMDVVTYNVTSDQHEGIVFHCSYERQADGGTTEYWGRDLTYYANLLADNPTHQCVIQETPDGMGCVTCLYT